VGRRDNKRRINGANPEGIRSFIANLSHNLQ